jgi:hypothetical protein
VQALKSENNDLKAKLSESKVGFEKALETASLLMSEIDDVGPLPPVSGSGHHANSTTNGHAQHQQHQNGHARVGGAQQDANGANQQQQYAAWQEWQQATASNSQPSTSGHAASGGQGGHDAWSNGQHQGHGQSGGGAWNGGNSYTAGYNSYNAGASSGFEPRWAGETQGEGKYARANNHHNGHARP